jgi:2-polyprenyl-3-methyl-5-hydroxy-6-metoxy-1,4-benzoquinol methylase
MGHDHYYLWLEMLGAVREQLRDGVRIADFGCNSGELLRMLFGGAPGLFGRVRPSLGIGIDLPAMGVVLEQATRTMHELPIVFCHAPLSSFPGQFDLILSHEVLYLVEDLNGFARDAYQALRPQGMLCAATMGYSENSYFRRWLPLMQAREIRAFDRPCAAYEKSLQDAGFSTVQTRPLLLSEGTYDAWKTRRPFDDKEWFFSMDDERRYFTQIGKVMMIARRGNE